MDNKGNRHGDMTGEKQHKLQGTDRTDRHGDTTALTKGNRHRDKSNFTIETQDKIQRDKDGHGNIVRQEGDSKQIK